VEQKESQRRQIVEKYLKEFPSLSKNRLAKKIYEENNLYFTTKETVRSHIRYLTGASGKGNLKKVISGFLGSEAVARKYNLPEPVVEENYEILKVDAKCALIFSDVHIPFQDNAAIEKMFDYAIPKKPDAIFIISDLMDCFAESSFCIEPDVIRLKEEIEMTRQFLQTLKDNFPGAKIYYKFGNHEKRHDMYIQQKAPEIWGLEGLRLDSLLKLADMGINYIAEDRIMDLNGLILLHGHEYKNAITSPANPARSLFLRTKATACCGHYHQTSEHSEPTVNGEMISTWSLGCLCQMHPKYMPLNKWTQGFAMYYKHDDGFWHIENKKIMSGHIV
jgi:UDP-2,3-diacylglucosamine pyrophosphatase LpxH